MQEFGTLNCCTADALPHDHPPLQVGVFPYQPVPEDLSGSLSSAEVEDAPVPTVKILISIPAALQEDQD